MNCRIARAYGQWPHESWSWPYTYWRMVRDELVESWKLATVRREEEDA